MNSLYQQAIQASKEYALRSCEEGYELTVPVERYWDGTEQRLTIHYSTARIPLCYTVSHVKPTNIMLTGDGAKLISEEEVFERTHYLFH